MLGYTDVYEAADHVMDIDPFRQRRLKAGPQAVRKYREAGWPTSSIWQSAGGKRLADGGIWCRPKRGCPRSCPSSHGHVAAEVQPAQHEAVHRPGGHGAHLGVRESGLGATALVPVSLIPGRDGKILPSLPRSSAIISRSALAYHKYEYNPALYGHLDRHAFIAGLISI